ncbi:hypothetical protein C8J57DRAFT_1563227 [Mycena rebaudengoi]|nr:hypothetical protein C8J57DRAFT_1563227 [Mycena rebaudengoi]
MSTLLPPPPPALEPARTPLDHHSSTSPRHSFLIHPPSTTTAPLCRIRAVAALPPCLRVPTTFPSPNAAHPSVKSGDKTLPAKFFAAYHHSPAQPPPTTSPAPSPLDGGIYGLPATSFPFSRRAEHAAPSFSPLYRLPAPARIDSCAVGGDILTSDMSRRLTHTLPTRGWLRSFSFTQNTNFTDLTPRRPAATLMLIFHSPPRLPASTFRVAPAYSPAPAPLFSNPAPTHISAVIFG